MKTSVPRFLPAAAVLVGLAGLSAPGAATAQLRGSVEIDGSSTVGPITSAVQSEFQNEYPGVDVTVNVSGTGGGFKRFAAGETDVSNASRPIKAKEMDTAAGNGVQFVEIPVAYDGLSIVVHPANDWFQDVTVEQLQRIFLSENQGSVKTWKDVDPSYPDTRIAMYIPGTDSGTFDYFKEVVAGKTGSIRSDVSVSEDDNQLVRGIVGDEGAIGFFGSSYYFENQDRLRALEIVNDAGEAVGPTPESIESGAYNPFSRPLFIYVNAASLDEPAVREFVNFYLDIGPEMAEEVGYVRLPEEVYEAARRKVADRVTGSVMSGSHEPVTEAYVK